MRKRLSPKTPKLKKLDPPNPELLVTGMVRGMVSGLLNYAGCTRHYQTDLRNSRDEKPPISAGRGGKHYRHQSREFI